MSDETMKADGFEWLTAKLGAKQERVPQPTRDDVRIAEKFLSEPEVTRRLALGIAGVSDAIRLVMRSGITEEGICLLIQNLIPNLKNGAPVPFTIISNVLVGAANLDRYLIGDKAAPGKMRRTRKDKGQKRK